MPRYVYKCESCDSHFQIRHSMSETQELCKLCNEVGLLTRVPQMPSIKKETKKQNHSDGTLTKNFIEKNRASSRHEGGSKESSI